MSSMHSQRDISSFLCFERCDISLDIRERSPLLVIPWAHTADHVGALMACIEAALERSEASRVLVLDEMAGMAFTEKRALETRFNAILRAPTDCVDRLLHAVPPRERALLEGLRGLAAKDLPVTYGTLDLEEEHAVAAHTAIAQRRLGTIHAVDRFLAQSIDAVRARHGFAFSEPTEGSRAACARSIEQTYRSRMEAKWHDDGALLSREREQVMYEQIRARAPHDTTMTIVLIGADHAVIGRDLADETRCMVRYVGLGNTFMRGVQWDVGVHYPGSITHRIAIANARGETIDEGLRERGLVEPLLQKCVREALARENTRISDRVSREYVIRTALLMTPLDEVREITTRWTTACTERETDERRSELVQRIIDQEMMRWMEKSFAEWSNNSFAVGRWLEGMYRRYIGAELSVEE
jgi:hypothetical protein